MSIKQVPALPTLVMFLGDILNLTATVSTSVCTSRSEGSELMAEQVYRLLKT
jgi:hypothetical protein